MCGGVGEGGCEDEDIGMRSLLERCLRRGLMLCRLLVAAGGWYVFIWRREQH